MSGRLNAAIAAVAVIVAVTFSVPTGSDAAWQDASRPSDAPWSAALIDSPSGEYLSCSAVLIALDRIATSAECVEYGLYGSTVAAGALSESDGSGTRQERQVVDVAIHPHYLQPPERSQKWYFGIAVLELDAPFVLTESVRPIQLADPSQTGLEPPESVNVVASGFPRFSPGGSQRGWRLRHTQAPLISQSRCFTNFVASIACVELPRASDDWCPRGGGAMTTGSGASARLVGVLSRDSCYWEDEIVTRVDNGQIRAFLEGWSEIPSAPIPIPNVADAFFGSTLAYIGDSTLECQTFDWEGDQIEFTYEFWNARPVDDLLREWEPVELVQVGPSARYREEALVDPDDPKSFAVICYVRVTSPGGTFRYWGDVNYMWPIPGWKPSGPDRPDGGQTGPFADRGKVKLRFKGRVRARARGGMIRVGKVRCEAVRTCQFKRPRHAELRFGEVRRKVRLFMPRKLRGGSEKVVYLRLRRAAAVKLGGRRAVVRFRVRGTVGSFSTHRRVRIKLMRRPGGDRAARPRPRSR